MTGQRRWCCNLSQSKYNMLSLSQLTLIIDKGFRNSACAGSLACNIRSYRDARMSYRHRCTCSIWAFACLNAELQHSAVNCNLPVFLTKQWEDESPSLLLSCPSTGAAQKNPTSAWTSQDESSPDCHRDEGTNFECLPVCLVCVWSPLTPDGWNIKRARDLVIEKKKGTKECECFISTPTLVFEMNRSLLIFSSEKCCCLVWTEQIGQL